MNHTITRAIKKVFAFVAVMFLPMVAMGIVPIHSSEQITQFHNENEQFYKKINDYFENHYNDFQNTLSLLHNTDHTQFVSEILRLAALPSKQESQLTELFNTNSIFGPVPELSIYNKSESQKMANMLRDALREIYNVDNTFSRNVYFFYIIKRIFDFLFHVKFNLLCSSNPTMEECYSFVEKLWNAIKKNNVSINFMENCAKQAYNLAVEQEEYIKGAIGDYYQNLSVIHKFAYAKDSDGVYFKTMMMFYMSQAYQKVFAVETKNNVIPIISSKKSGAMRNVQKPKKSSCCHTFGNVAKVAGAGFVGLFLFDLINKNNAQSIASENNETTIKNTTEIFAPTPTPSPTPTPTSSPAPTPMPTQQPVAQKTYKGIMPCGQRLKNVPERSCNSSKGSKVCCYGDGTSFSTKKACQDSFKLQQYKQSSYASPKWYFEINNEFKKCESFNESEPALDMNNNKTKVADVIKQQAIHEQSSSKNLVCSVDHGAKCSDFFSQHSDNVDTSNIIKNVLNQLATNNNTGNVGAIQKLQKEQKKLRDQFLSVEDSAHDKKRLEELYHQTTLLSKDIFTQKLQSITQIVDALENSHLSHEEVINLPIIKKINNNTTLINHAIQSLNYPSDRDIEQIYRSLSEQENAVSNIANKIKDVKLFIHKSETVVVTLKDEKERYNLFQCYMIAGGQWLKFVYGAGSFTLEKCDKPKNLLFVNQFKINNNNAVEKDYYGKVFEFFKQTINSLD